MKLKLTKPTLISLLLLLPVWANADDKKSAAVPQDDIGIYRIDEFSAVTLTPRLEKGGLVFVLKRNRDPSPDVGAPAAQLDLWHSAQ